MTVHQGISEWLQAQDRAGITHGLFEVVDVSELRPAEEADLVHLASLLRTARWQAGYLEAVANALGWDRVGEFVRDRQPRATTARRGQFGEVLSTGLLRELHGYEVPVEKLRYAITGSQSQPAADALALIVDDSGSISEVCWVESKLRTNPDRSVAASAVEQLTGDVTEEPAAILEFVSQRLFETSDRLFEPFLAYMATRADTREMERYRVFIVLDSTLASDGMLQDLEDSVPTLSPLHMHMVLVADLRRVTDETFSKIGVKDLIDDDD